MTRVGGMLVALDRLFITLTVKTFEQRNKCLGHLRTLSLFFVIIMKVSELGPGKRGIGFLKMMIRS